MLGLIVLVGVGLVFGYFATQNSINIPINFAGNTIPDLPLYIVIGSALLLGLLISWLISLINSLAVAFKMHGKELTIKDAQKEIVNLENKINELETENTNLKEKLEKAPETDNA